MKLRASRLAGQAAALCGLGACATAVASLLIMPSDKIYDGYYTALYLAYGSIASGFVAVVVGGLSSAAHRSRWATLAVASGPCAVVAGFIATGIASALPWGQ